MKKTLFYSMIIPALFLWSCQREREKPSTTKEDFNYKVDQFADLQILRYQVHGFDQLDLEKKKLVYYLYQAALSGRDIFYDQNNQHNLTIRRTIEAVIDRFGTVSTDPSYAQFLTYAKRFWASNGIHHFYAMNKLKPDFSKEYLMTLLDSVAIELLPIPEDKSLVYFKTKDRTIAF